MAEPKKYEDLSQEEKKEFLQNMQSFYLSDKGDKGLGRSFVSFEAEDSKKYDQISQFFDKDGNPFIDEEQLYNSLQKGTPVFAYRNGEETPCPVSYGTNNQFTIGENVSSLKEPAKPGFFDYIKGYLFRNQNSLNKITAHNQYTEKKKNAQIFLSEERKQTRRDNYIPNEKQREINANAENKNLMRVQKTQRLEAKENQFDKPEDKLKDPKRWENVSFEKLCIELDKRMQLNDVNLYNDVEVENRREEFEQNIQNKDYRQASIQRGKTIFANAVVTGKENIVEAIVADIVEGTATDKQIKDLNQYLKLGTINKDARDNDVYKKVNFKKDAAVNEYPKSAQDKEKWRREDIPDEPMVVDILEKTERMAKNRPEFDTVSKYLALCALNTKPVKINSVGMEEYSNRKMSAFENIGLSVMKYQSVVGSVNNNKILTDNELKSIRDLQIIQASYGIKVAGDPLPIHLMNSSDNSFTMRSRLGKTSQYQNKSIGGKRMLDEMSTSTDFSNLLKEKGVLVTEDMDSKTMAKKMTQPISVPKVEMLTALSNMMEKKSITSIGSNINETLNNNKQRDTTFEISSENNKKIARSNSAGTKKTKSGEMHIG